MKMIKTYSGFLRRFEKNSKYFISEFVNESLESSRVTISEFVERIGIREDLKPNIIDFWNQNRSEIKIHLFPFQSTKPIAGVFLGTDTIVINERMPMPPHIKLFLAFHESRHCDQYRDGGFMEGYYDTVVNGDREAFLQAYSRFERDANDFAISSMRACGFEREMNFEEMRLRGNERAGDMVYQMMSGDIQSFNPVDFFDLLKKQIGV